MLRVNLIGQRIQDERRAQSAWMFCFIVVACLVTSAILVSLVSFWRIHIAESQIRDYDTRIARAKADYEQAQELEKLVTTLQPAATLAGEVRGTAGKWGALLRGIQDSVPDRGGYWLESIETRFDPKKYEQVCTLRGSAQRQELVGDLVSRLTELTDSVDGEKVTAPNVTVKIDEQAGTQIAEYTVEAELRDVIGVDWQ